MIYCERCGGSIMWQHSTAIVEDKHYHLVCAMKEKYRHIPLRKEKDENQHRPDEGFVDTLPPT